jgi:hypothetical protein
MVVGRTEGTRSFCGFRGVRTHYGVAGPSQSCSTSIKEQPSSRAAALQPLMIRR